MTNKMDRQPRTWVLLTFGDERQWAGNAGYDDDVRKWYSYDSYVANHRQLQPEDFVILCDRASVLGFARIQKIESHHDKRLILRCPVCRKSSIKKRKTMDPAYRCGAGHEFDDPIKEHASCIAYKAAFGESFQQFSERFGRESLRAGCPRYSDQLAMQEFDFRLIERAFADRYPEATRLIRSAENY